MWNLPNQLTLLRIGMIPVFVILYYLPWGWSHVASAAIFGLAALTDWVDGYLARKMGLESSFGAFLDPVADKLIVIVALIMLLHANPTIWFALPTVVIVGREVVISALREWMAERALREEVAVSMIGKVKTWVQMAAIIFLLLAGKTFGALAVIGYLGLYVSAGLALWSMWVYLKQAWPEMRGEKDTESESTEDA
ncbi:MAG: CDP-diacylglycerol--glycerol-3-phosphate 3-phosphatidyltransferase [Porticoccaceae bacterium]